MELMESSQGRIAFYQKEFHFRCCAGKKSSDLGSFSLLMMVLKTVKTEKAECVVFSNFVIVCRRPRGWWFAGTNDQLFLYDDRKQLQFRNAKGSATLPLGKLLGNRSFQVVLSIKTLESHVPQRCLRQSHCQLGETCRIHGGGCRKESLNFSAGESISHFSVHSCASVLVHKYTEFSPEFLRQN